MDLNQAKYELLNVHLFNRHLSYLFIILLKEVLDSLSHTVKVSGGNVIAHQNIERKVRLNYAQSFVEEIFVSFANDLLTMLAAQFLLLHKLSDT